MHVEAAELVEGVGEGGGVGLEGEFDLGFVFSGESDSE